MPTNAAAAPPPLKVIRFPENPIIRPGMPGNPGGNINGPALVRAPDWVEQRLGRYYLYFAHHEGDRLRLAYADDLHGPWRIYAPGVLPCSALPWRPDHIASPDVAIDEENREFLLYFHTPVAPMIRSDHPDYYRKVLSVPQKTFLAVSRNGLDFTLHSERAAADFYLRVWKWRDHWYGLARGGRPLYRSRDGRVFERTPGPFSASPEEFGNIRHVAVATDGDTLTVFYSCMADAPERIFAVRLAMTEDWENWRITEHPRLALAPETAYEGADLPVVPSKPGSAPGRENALRDPCVFKEDGRMYLLYSVAGESGIAVAELR